MNKTVIININGTIFHIEEDAYEILKKYMTAIKLHFSSYDDSMEIITDIEHRIAEMFSEELTLLQKEVITSSEVLKVTAKMGNPDQFDEEQPEQEPSIRYTYKPIKKLYRDVENGKLSGVCAGIAHYFDINPNWVRAAFVFSVLFYGFGTLLYLLFWIIMPKAKTRTERMEMKGEAINLQSFQRNLEEELGSLKDKFNKNFSSGLTTVESKAGNMLNELVIIIKRIVKLFIKVVSFFFAFVISIMVIILIVCLLAFLGYSNNTEISTIFPLNALSPDYRTTVLVCGFLLILIPLVSILLLIFRVVFNSLIGKSAGFSLLMIWILALGTGVYFLSKNMSDFKEEAAFNETVNLSPTISKTYYLQVGEERTLQSVTPNGGRNITIFGNDRDFDNPDKVNLDLQIADASKPVPVLIKSYSARGKNFKSALENARHIQYFYEQKDSLLNFDYKSNLRAGELWRNQEVKLILKVPVGTTLYIQQDLAYRLLNETPYDCIDSEADGTTLIKVTAEKDGFVCRKTEEAISNQKKWNLEHENTEEVKEFLTF